jgi:hypothetical protein
MVREDAAKGSRFRNKIQIGNYPNTNSIESSP